MVTLGVFLLLFLYVGNCFLQRGEIADVDTEFRVEPRESPNLPTKFVLPSPAIPSSNVYWPTGNLSTRDILPCSAGRVPPPPPAKHLRTLLGDPAVSVSVHTAIQNTCPASSLCAISSVQLHPARRRLTELLEPAVHSRVLALRVEARMFTPSPMIVDPSSCKMKGLGVPENPADVVATIGASNVRPSDDRDLRGSESKVLTGASSEGSSGRNVPKLSHCDATNFSHPVQSATAAQDVEVSDMISSKDGGVGVSVGRKLLASSKGLMFPETVAATVTEASSLSMAELDPLVGTEQRLLQSTRLTSHCDGDIALSDSRDTGAAENGGNCPSIPNRTVNCREPSEPDAATSLGEVGSCSDGRCTLSDAPTAVPGRQQPCSIGLGGAEKGSKTRKLPSNNKIVLSLKNSQDDAIRWFDALGRNPGWFHRGKWAASWKKMMVLQWEWRNALQQRGTVSSKGSPIPGRHIASHFFVTSSEARFLLECVKTKQNREPEWYRNWKTHVLDNIASPRIRFAKLQEICRAEQKQSCSTNGFGRNLPLRIRELCRQRCNGKTSLNPIERMNQAVAARMLNEVFVGLRRTTNLNIVERANQAILAHIRNKALLPGHYLLSVDSPALNVRVVPAANITIHDGPVNIVGNFVAGPPAGDTIQDGQVQVDENSGLLHEPPAGRLVPLIPFAQEGHGVNEQDNEMHPDLRRCFAEAPNRPYIFRRGHRHYQHLDDEAEVASQRQDSGDPSQRQRFAGNDQREPISYGRRRRFRKRGCQSSRCCQSESWNFENASTSDEEPAEPAAKVKKVENLANRGPGGGADLAGGKVSDDSSNDGNFADMAEYDSA